MQSTAQSSSLPWLSDTATRPLSDACQRRHIMREGSDCDKMVCSVFSEKKLRRLGLVKVADKGWLPYTTKLGFDTGSAWDLGKNEGTETGLFGHSGATV